jgi:hypothetical protein
MSRTHDKEGRIIADWVAVTENFGCWGVTAQFENTEGIKLEE